MSTKTRKRLQKVASIVTSGATILWLSGISMLAPVVGATYADGTLLKGSAADIWVVNNNLKVQVRSADVFTSSGYDWAKITTVSDSALNAVATADLIKTATNPDVYRLEKDFSRKLASIEIFNSYSLDWNKISVVSSAVMGSFSYAPIFQYGVDLYWRDANNVLHQFTSMDAFTECGYQTRDLIVVNASEFGSFAVGSAIYATVTPPAGTGLAVSLASDTPVAVSIPQKATNVPFMKFNLTAGADGAVTVTNLTLKRVGVGSASDFEYVYLFDGATRLTTGRSVNSSTNEASFASLGLSIAAGTTKTLTVSVDMQDTSGSIASGNVNAFQIVSASAVGTTATVSGTFPITGNSMTVGGSAVGTLDVDKGANPTNPKVGELNVPVSEFKLNVSNEEASIKRISLYQAGSISRANLSNLKLYIGDTLLASVAALDSSDLAVFDMTASPYTLPKSITRIFTVKADVAGTAKPNDTIRFYIDQTTDIFAVGATYGSGVYVDIGQALGTFNGTDSSKYTEVTVQGGQITVSTSGPVAASMAKGSNDMNFLSFSIASVANSQIKKLRIEFHAVGTDLDASQTTATEPYISDVKVIDTDSNVAITSTVGLNNFTDIGTNAGVYYQFTDVIDLTAGATRNFKVTADLSTSISTGQIYVTLGQLAATSYVFDTTSIKNTENNQWVTDIVPSSAISGQYQTIVSSGLTLTLATTPASETYIKGATNVSSVGIIFKAASGADIKITSIRIGGYVSDYSAGALTLYETGSLRVTDMVPSVTLWDNSVSPAVQLGTSEVFNTSGKATFDGFTLNITKGTSKTLVVKANTSNSVSLDTVEADVGRFAVDIADVSEDVNSVDAETLADVDPTPDAINAATTAGGTVITLRDSGSMTAVRDAGSPASALVIAGASSQVFTKVKFTAVSEELKITKLQVSLSDTTNDPDNIASVSVEGGGMAAVSQSMSSGGTIDFTGLSIIVPKDSSAVVTIKATLTTITGGADSGDDPILGITATNFEAVGTGTSNTKLTAATGLPKNGLAMYVKATVPTVAAIASPTAGTLANGTQSIYKFTVTNTASSGGYDVSFKKLEFDLNINNSVYVSGETGPTITGLKLYRSGETTAVSDVGFFDGAATTATHVLGKEGQTGTVAVDLAAGTSTTQFIMFLNSDWSATGTGEEIVAAGESRTYEIKATVAGVGNGASSKDTIMVRISDSVMTDSSVHGLVYQAARGVDVKGHAVESSFIWSDNSAGVSHKTTVDNSDTDGDWTDGYLVKTLATDYYSLSQ